MKKIYLIMAIVAVLFCSTNQVLSATTNCVDSDNGKVFNVKGTITYLYNGLSRSATDYCFSDTSLVERYCASGGAFNMTQICEYGCDVANGICKEASTSTGTSKGTSTGTGGTTTQTGKCSETDDGQDPWKYGVLTDYNGVQKMDYCSGNFVGEYHCTGETTSSFEYIPCKYGCSNNACIAGCSDSETSKDYFIKGVVTLDITSYSIPNQNKYLEDTCNGKTLKEYFCKDGVLSYDETICENGCSAGACMPAGCSDSDAGSKIFIKGIVSTNSGQTFTDSCNNNYVKEYTCESGVVKSNDIYCSAGCSNGACNIDCTDSDNGKDPFTKGFLSRKSSSVLNYDYCTSSNTKVLENFCNLDTGLIDSIITDCKNGCVDGACVPDCKPDWQAREWSVCSTVTLTQTKEYYDVNNCNNLKDKPVNETRNCSVIDNNNSNTNNLTCTDSDNGKNYFTRGNTYLSNMLINRPTDVCSVDKKNLTEYYCENGVVKSEIVPCANGCLNGVCNSTCSDSDNGKSYYEMGTTISGTSSITDKCYDKNPKWLQEFYCDTDGQRKFEWKFCSLGCENGVCIKAEETCEPNWICGDFGACNGGTQTQTCTQTNCISQSSSKTQSQTCDTSKTCSDSDNGKDYFTKGFGTNYLGQKFDDKCVANRLTEVYCSNSGDLMYDFKTCDSAIGAYKCESGACVATTCTPNWTCTSWGACSNSSQSRTCTDSNNCGVSTNKPAETQSCIIPGVCNDSDGGETYSVKGTTTKDDRSSTDSCSGTTLTEYYCGVNGIMTALVTCDAGCENGVCKAVVAPNCTDPDGRDYFRKEAITYNGVLYSDRCDPKYPNYVLEYYCDSTGQGKGEWGSCPNGCDGDGACRESTPVCTPNYTSCDSWSTCSGGQKTRTCTQFNCPDKDKTKIETEGCVTGVCSDPDKKDYFKKGTTIAADGNTHVDVCSSSNELMEYYCIEDQNLIQFEVINCECENGACKYGLNWVCGEYEACINGKQSRTCFQNNFSSQNLTKTQTRYCDGARSCFDSDNGKNYWFKGYVENSSGTRFSDTCMSSNSLVEHYCDGVNTKTETYVCKNGCENDACKFGNVACFDSDGGLNALNKGFVIIGNTSNADTCVNRDSLTEYTCSSNGQLMEIGMRCNSDCVDGVCTPKETCIPNWVCGDYGACVSGTQTKTCYQSNCPSQDKTKVQSQSCMMPGSCIDSDGGGKNQFYYGGDTKGTHGTFGTDFCAGKYLGEYSCKPMSNNWYVGTFTSYLCVKGCDISNRACYR